MRTTTKTYKKLLIALLMVVGVGTAAVLPRTALAAAASDSSTVKYACGASGNGNGTTAYDPKNPATAPCASAKPSATPDSAAGSKCTSANSSDCGGLVTKYINPIVNFLAGAVGLVVTISIVVGGIQYASSAGDAQKVTAAKSRITNSVIALVMFIFLYAFLQWLIPGGFLNT